VLVLLFDVFELDVLLFDVFELVLLDVELLLAANAGETSKLPVINERNIVDMIKNFVILSFI
jgi:hypothetical protein